MPEKCFEKCQTKKSKCKKSSCRYWLKNASNYSCVLLTAEQPFSMDEIAELFNISKTRIMQIENMATQKLFDFIKTET